MRRAASSAAGLAARRWFSATAGSGPRRRGVNLTAYASPLLLRLHPDAIQRHSADMALENAEAMKQLNAFLALANDGCNNDAFRTRKQLLSLSQTHRAPSDSDEYVDEREAPLHFPLQFHVLAHEQPPKAVKYVIQVPSLLVRRTLIAPHTARQDEDAPLARAWQRATKRVLQDLFQLAEIPLVTTQEGDAESDGEVTSRTAKTQLALWLEEEDAPERQHGLNVASHNRRQQREHEDFDKTFLDMLTREKNIVHTFTTGMEDGPTSQHGVLMSLISQRVVLPKLEDPKAKQYVFNWIANFLLMNFMELRLHSLVWNKVTLLVTLEPTTDDKPEVMWDQDHPEQGMGVLIPAGMETNDLVECLAENLEELELALDERAYRQQRAAKEASHMKQKPQKKKRRKHFFAEEVAALYRRH